MSNIIEFKKKRIKSPRFFSQIQKYWDELEDKRMLMDAVMENAAEELQERGYNPADFIVDRNTMYDSSARLSGKHIKMRLRRDRVF